jgi:hypothetical protein
MRGKRICAMLLCFVVALSVMSMVLAEETKGPKPVSITGKVIWPGYKADFGPMVIAAVSKDYSVLASTQISSPGEYTLNVPQDKGKVNISFDTVNKDILIEKMIHFNKTLPLALDSGNVKDVDIRVTETKVDLMHAYKGKKVKVSGNIIFKEFQPKGAILVCLTRERGVSRRDAEIKKTISMPGKYEIEVPEDYGTAFIWAVYLSADELWLSLRTEIEVGKDNIEGINLDIVDNGRG